MTRSCPTCGAQLPDAGRVLVDGWLWTRLSRDDDGVYYASLRPPGDIEIQVLQIISGQPQPHRRVPEHVAEYVVELLRQRHSQRSRRRRPAADHPWRTRGHFSEGER